MSARTSPRELALLLARARFPQGSDRGETAVAHNIMDSWARSALAGVDPSGTTTPHSDFDPDSALAHAARGPIEQLVHALGSLDVGVVLSDEHARIIGRIDTARRVASLLNAIDLVPGHDYSESSVGTNGVGSVVLTRRPFYVSGAAHFQGRFSDYVCAGAPVFHPLTGRLEGVIDMSCGVADASPLMRSLVVQTALSIQHALLESATRVEHEALHVFTELTASGTGSSSSLVLATAGQLRLQNPRAERLLTTEGIRAILRRAEEELLARTEADFTMTASGVVAGEERLALRVRASRIVAGPGDENGVSPFGVLVRAERVEQRRPSASVPAAGDSRSFDVVDRIDFGLRMASRSWQLARRDLTATLRAGRTALVLGEVGTGKVSLVREAARRARPGARVLTVAAEELEDTPLAALLAARCGELDPPVAAGEEIVAVLRNAHRFPPRAVREAQELLRALRLGAFRFLPVLTGESLEEDEDSFLDRLLPAVSHSIIVPSLRHRREDFPAIVSRIMQAVEPGSFDRLSPAVLDTLTEGHWPGNIHQLTDALRAAIRHRPEGTIMTADLPPHAFHAALRRLTPLEREERHAIISALYRARGNRSATARTLGLSRATLYRKLASYGLLDA